MLPVRARVRRGLLGLGSLTVALNEEAALATDQAAVTCSSTKCVPSPLYAELFKQFQSQLNLANTKLGGRYKPIEVTGVIDAPTMAMYDYVAGQISPGGNLPTIFNTWIRGSQMHDVAISLDSIVPELIKYVNYMPVIPTAVQTAETPTATVTTSPTPTVVPVAPKKSWLKYAAIGAGALLLGFFVKDGVEGSLTGSKRKPSKTRRDEDDIVYENDTHWVSREPNGDMYVWRTGLTHSTRVGTVGRGLANQLQRAKAEADRRDN